MIVLGCTDSMDKLCSWCWAYSMVYIYIFIPGGTSGKEPTCQCRRLGNSGWIPELGRSPGEGNGNPLQYSCLENLLGQRSLTGYSLWCHEELDMTEHLHACVHTHTHTHIHLLTVTPILLSPQPLASNDLLIFSMPVDVPMLALHTNRITQYAAFCVWLLSLSIMFLRFIIL